MWQIQKKNAQTARFYEKTIKIQQKSHFSPYLPEIFAFQAQAVINHHDNRCPSEVRTQDDRRYLSDIAFNAHVSRRVNANGARCYCSHLNETNIPYSPTNTRK